MIATQRLKITDVFAIADIMETAQIVRYANAPEERMQAIQPVIVRVGRSGQGQKRICVKKLMMTETVAVAEQAYVMPE